VSAGDDSCGESRCARTAEDSYYQRSVTLYEQIAEIDPGHELEALYWAQREKTHAANIAAQIRAQAPR
jgi:hypothetical protein